MPSIIASVPERLCQELCGLKAKQMWEVQAGPFRSVPQEGFPLQHQHRSSSSLHSGTAFPRPKGEYQFKYILSCSILHTGLILPSPPLRPQLLKLLMEF